MTDTAVKPLAIAPQAGGIVRTGFTSDDPANGLYEIGVGEGEGRGDGTLTVNGPATWSLTTERPTDLMLLVGGYGSSGVLTLAGAGAVAQMAGGTAARSMTTAIIGGDTGGGSSTGLMTMTGGAQFVMLGSGSTGSTGEFGVGSMFGNGNAQVNASTISLAGFEETRVNLGAFDGTGTLALDAGARLDVAGMRLAAIDIGTRGTGLLSVEGGSVVDLNGKGTIQAGGPGPDIGSSFGWGIVEVAGAGSAVRGIQTAWFGSDPATVTDTPRSRGTLDVSGGGVFGNAGAAINLGVMGQINAGTGTLVGTLGFDGGGLWMIADPVDTLDLTGDLVVRSGSNIISLASNATQGDLLRIDGGFEARGGTVVVELMGAEGYRYVDRDRHVLMTADYFEFADPAKVQARVHAGFNPDFGFVFGVERGVGPDRFVFEALSNMDGPGAPVLTLGGDQGPATARYDAASSQVLIEGGRFQNAWAQNLDALTGSQNADSLFMAGMTERIVLAGAGGDDTLVGGDGNDVLNGGEGTDRLNGGAGDDLLFGGVSVNDLRDLIFGGDGNDRIDGGYGNDELYGGNGNDTVEGGFGVDTLFGQDGNDVLSGGAFSDLIFGGAGNDFLNGGFGSDRLNGGAGADGFYHLGVAGHGSDWVQDYAAAQGDRLVFGGAAVRSQFQVNFAQSAGAGAADVDEAFVIYRPTGQILWALVDGGAQDSITLQLGNQLFDLLA